MHQNVSVANFGLYFSPTCMKKEGMSCVGKSGVCPFIFTEQCCAIVPPENFPLGGGKDHKKMELIEMDRRQTACTHTNNAKNGVVWVVNWKKTIWQIIWARISSASTFYFNVKAEKLVTACQCQKHFRRCLHISVANFHYLNPENFVMIFDSTFFGVQNFLFNYW